MKIALLIFAYALAFLPCLAFLIICLLIAPFIWANAYRIAGVHPASFPSRRLETCAPKL